MQAANKTDLSLPHRFEPGRPEAPVLLLLHGTGGDENDLMPLGRAISPHATLLSPRGAVLENGMPRFFRRLAEGVFDLDDLRVRTREMADFITAARGRYALADRPIVAVGFSNGANMAASLLLAGTGALQGAALLRAMVPFTPDVPPNLSAVPVLLLEGSYDPIVPRSNAEQLADLLRAGGADVALTWQPAGHQLTPGDVDALARWLATNW